MVDKGSLHFLCCFLLGTCAWVADVPVAFAQIDESGDDQSVEVAADEGADETGPAVDAEPWRWTVFGGVGGSLRLLQYVNFSQDRLAPFYLDIQGGLVVPGSGRLRHGVLVGINTNISRDSILSSKVEVFSQWTLTPYYYARYALDDKAVSTWVVTGKVGVPLTVTPRFNPGLELALGGIFFPFAGAGVYAELGASMFFGAQDNGGALTVHPMLSLELGVTIDLEIL